MMSSGGGGSERPSGSGLGSEGGGGGDNERNTGLWSLEEDDLLFDYVDEQNRNFNWKDVAKNSGLSRLAKSCRDRWTYHLQGYVKGPLIAEEGERVHQLQAQFGNQWSCIAGELPGRTANQVKNYCDALKRRHGATATSSSAPSLHSGGKGLSAQEINEGLKFAEDVLLQPDDDANEEDNNGLHREVGARGGEIQEEREGAAVTESGGHLVDTVFCGGRDTVDQVAGKNEGVGGVGQGGGGGGGDSGCSLASSVSPSPRETEKKMSKKRGREL